MKGFDDWGSYSNNTFKVHWKNVHHNTENQHDGGDLNIEIYQTHDGIKLKGMSSEDLQINRNLQMKIVINSKSMRVHQY